MGSKRDVPVVHARTSAFSLGFNPNSLSSVAMDETVIIDNSGDDVVNVHGA